MSVIGESGRQRLLARLALEASNLINLAGFGPVEVARLYIDLSIAVALRGGVSPTVAATTLRDMAACLDQLAEPESGPSPSGAELN